ncbi:hypothetical protein AMAG_13347 [Allomyces macrogynus ATCC 38327]|uniref:Uncharacterized protein n=1 Tax=Allomyces macrogynus (strain ATCC 38327) TaxID=578462 RepID=A0A0L0T245_ALLM3|nr:hypothetical protein AMAG_13347 [Allomyces macrogynus ATCC 38327]|eukprot:KNE68705.1 hypothetical protein AMAG_13347 [Allomyces macrogynus ATCC 38327]
MWHPSNDASSNAAPCLRCAPPLHPHGPPTWQHDAGLAIPHVLATPVATPPGPHVASPPAVVRDPGSGRIPIAALLNNDDDEAMLDDDDDDVENEAGAAMHDHATLPLPMSPLVLGPPTSRSATWPQIGAAAQHHAAHARGFPALTATWPSPPAATGVASTSPRTPTVPPTGSLARASPAVPARRAVSARSSSISSSSPATAPAAAAPVRPFYVFTRASYRLMVECVKRGEIPSAGAIRTADPGHALSLKRWKRLQGNLKVVPVRVRVPGRAEESAAAVAVVDRLVWKTCVVGLWIVPVEDWPTVVHQAHLERALDGSVRHASLQRTLQQLTSAYQYRRSRSGLTSDDVRRILATCTCHVRNTDEEDDEGSLDHHHHTPVSPTTSTSSASVDGEVESTDPDWRKRARSPSRDDNDNDDESSSLSPVSPLRLRAHGPPTPPSPLHGSGLLVDRARASVRRAVSVRGGVRPWTPPQVEG